MISNAQKHAEFLNLRLLRDDMLSICLPEGPIAKWYYHYHFTPEEIDVNDTRCAELLFEPCERTAWEAFCAWLGCEP